MTDIKKNFKIHKNVNYKVYTKINNKLIEKSLLWFWIYFKLSRIASFKQIIKSSQLFSQILLKVFNFQLFRQSFNLLRAQSFIIVEWVVFYRIWSFPSDFFYIHTSLNGCYESWLLVFSIKNICNVELLDYIYSFYN